MRQLVCGTQPISHVIIHVTVHVIIHVTVHVIIHVTVHVVVQPVQFLAMNQWHVVIVTKDHERRKRVRLDPNPFIHANSLDRVVHM